MSVFNKKYQVENEIYFLETKDDVLKTVENFYNIAPFPAYETSETKFDILKKRQFKYFSKSIQKILWF